MRIDLKSLKKSVPGVLGVVLIGTLMALAIVSIWWTPFNPLEMNFDLRFAAPSAQHWLGTDEFGRDELSRVMAGASTSMLVAAATVMTAVVVGTIIGSIAGYFPGWFDRLVRVLSDSLMAFPGILLALGVMLVIGRNRYGIVIALGLAYIPTVLRVVRTSVLSMKHRGFVEASRLMGNSEIYTMFRHVLPNCVSPLVVLATSMFGWVILAESALSYLGVGVPPPAPTWGNMLAASRPYMDGHAWLSVLPGICIACAMLGVNLLGDRLRDRLDPRMRAAV